MLKRISFLIVLLLGVFRIVDAQQLSDQAQVSIVTCGNGEDIYSLFGHSAVRVYDPSLNIDRAYNFGTFNFEKPGFTLNFLRGKLLYELRVSTYERFLLSYHYEKRSVKEQVLALTPQEAQKLFIALERNALPENKEYWYDFYFDNCTTRIRDLLSKEIDEVNYPEQPIKEVSFRDMLHENLGGVPWTKFGMDLILGESSDDQANVEEQMFLPQYFFDYIETTQVSGKAIISTTNRVLEFPYVDSPNSVFTPELAMFLLLGIELLLFFLVYISGDHRFVKIWDTIWFGALLVCFLIFIFMWFGTNHKVCAKNWNLIWTVPYMILVTREEIKPKWQNILISLTIILSVGVLLFWSALPQQLPTAALFIILITLVKSLRQIGIIPWIDKHIKHGNLKPLVTFLLFCIATLTGYTQEKIGGITLVSPPREHTTNPMDELMKVNTSWVALVPYGFSRNGQPEVLFGSDRQWWGERVEGIARTIELAHEKNIKVMIKPQVWIRGGWVGEVDFETEEEWKKWEDTYRQYIMTFVDLAIKYDVDMLCVGTEYQIAVKKREAFWRTLIEDIRKVYDGRLVYSSNWDSYDDVPFWDQLDFVGISAYFPLSDMSTPMSMYLSFKWRSIVSKLKKYSKKVDRKILFTEYGYLSVDGAAGKTWELEKQVRELDINEKAQANALEALYSSFWEEEFWAGGFLWKWFPNGHGHEGYPERDYTPQGKIAESVVKNWYSKASP